eukprot:8423026-Alexandrium_andersonii.AAC.1
MSASLVGSEMCIRDRRLTPRLGLCLRRARTALWSPRWPRSPRSEEHEEAVSYTHLTLPTICSV